MAKQDGNQVTRRQFLLGTLAVSVLGLIGQAGAALVDFFRPRVQPGAFGSKVAAGQVTEYQPGTVSHVREGRFYLSRLDDGGMLALWHRCPHLGCTVPWREDEGQFHCPCHSSIFTPNGEVVSGPAPRPLDLFPIEIVNGELIVDTGAPVERSSFDPAQVTYG